MTRRDYQQQGVEAATAALREQGFFILADEMGLGKSAQAIWTAQELGARILVICPAVSKGVWREQWEKWGGPDADLDVPLVCEGLVPDVDPEDYPPPSLTICNYDILAPRKNVRKLKGGGYTTHRFPGWVDALCAEKFDMLVLDEAHAVKNGGSARTQAVQKLCASVKYKLALTGTPVWTELLDLWGLSQALKPWVLGTKFKFSQKYMKPYIRTWNVKGVEKGAWVYEGVNEETLPELRERLATFMLSRKKADVLKELPPKQWVVVPVDTRLSYMADGQTLSEAKVDTTVAQAELVLQQKPRVVIFAHYVNSVHEIALGLKGRAWMFTGDSTEREREDALRHWRDRGGALVMTTAAGGISLNLQEADTVIFNDLEPNPGPVKQAADRVHRLGQLNPCTIYCVVDRNTRDGAVGATLVRRLEAAETVTGGSAAELSLLSPEETLAEINQRITESYIPENEEDELDS